jgi:1-acyl-sn-glycerol-3-phosphate acyltransferase
VTIDGFQTRQASPFAGRSDEVSSRFFDVITRLARFANVAVEGTERVPPGRALIVTNHAFGFDAIFPIVGLWRATGRRAWVLGEHAWWKFPYLRRLAAAVGTVDGTPENARALLERDELVMVLPGGLREAMKPRDLRYRLLWGHRYGFVRAAAAAHAPIVPLASVGADDVFHLVGDAFQRGRRWLHRDFPVPRPAYGIPWPHRVALKYVFGEPIAPPAPDGAAEALRRTRREVAGAIHELIDEELSRRASAGG